MVSPVRYSRGSALVHLVYASLSYMCKHLCATVDLTALLGRALLAAACLLLTACVTHYYPAAESADGVYYAADDSGYAAPSTEYASVGYYPWWSIDHFYLHYGSYSSNFHFGISFSYPWNYYPTWGYWPGPYYYPYPLYVGFGYPSYYWLYPSYAWYGYPWHRYPWHGHHHSVYAHQYHPHYQNPHDPQEGGHPGAGSAPVPGTYDPRAPLVRHGEPEVPRFDFAGSGAAPPPNRGGPGGDGIQEPTRSVDFNSGGFDSSRGIDLDPHGKWTRSRLDPVSVTPVEGQPVGSASSEARLVPAGRFHAPGNDKSGGARTMPVSGTVASVNNTGSSGRYPATSARGPVTRGPANAHPSRGQQPRAVAQPQPRNSQGFTRSARPPTSGQSRSSRGRSASKPAAPSSRPANRAQKNRNR